MISAPVIVIDEILKFVSTVSTFFSVVQIVEMTDLIIGVH